MTKKKRFKNGQPIPKYLLIKHQSTLQFMLQSVAEGLFNRLDASLSPRVFLLGIRAKESRFQHRIGVIPEDAISDPTKLQNVIPEVERLQQLAFTEEAPALPMVEELQRSYVMGLLKFQQSLDKQFETLFASEDSVGKCSEVVLIEDTFVSVVLVLNRTAVANFPSLPATQSFGTWQFRSLLEGAIYEFLDISAAELRRATPGKNAPWPDAAAILKKAAVKFAANRYFSGDYGQDQFALFENCNTISSLRYEGGEGKGNIVVTARSHSAIKTVIEFRDPVSLKSHRATRKLLELSSKHSELLCANSQIYGLGEVVRKPKSDEQLICGIRFLRQHLWELTHKGICLMRVHLGEPSLPKMVFSKDELSDVLQRVFNGIQQSQIDGLVSVVNIATQQKHGTMIVISSDPGKESQRLRNQSTPITPATLSDEVLRSATGIDGAVLMGIDGTCHAIGVILDGRATDKGSPARGARYNSAVRYVRDVTEKTVAVVISEDGSVDIVPRLQPRIAKSELERALDELRTFAKESERYYDDFLAIMSWFEGHRFYLRAQECKEINEILDQIEGELIGDPMKYNVTRFTPDVDMDDSYFVDEQKQ